MKIKDRKSNTQVASTKHYYSWYRGNHCGLKCSPEKISTCHKKIENLLKKVKISSQKEFINLIRKDKNICDLSAAEYARNIYTEP